jgi:hypothetical protein
VIRLRDTRALPHVVAPDAASISTRVTGRAVRVVEIGIDELAGHYREAGMPADFAAALAGVDTDIRAGAEDRVTGSVCKLTGRAPRSFADFIRADLSFLGDVNGGVNWGSGAHCVIGQVVGVSLLARA